MKKLTDNQKEFLLTQFFKNEEFPGWKDIAIKLIEQGSCIVAGDKCIWNGGIGNYIETNTEKDFVGCLRYTFNLKLLMHSAWYEDIFDHYLDKLDEEKQTIGKKYDELNDLK